MFLIKTKYLKPTEQIDSFRDAHIAYFKKLANANKILGGGRLNDNSGAIIITLVNDPIELNEIINNDPYVINNLISYEVLEFNIKGLMREELISFLKLK